MRIHSSTAITLCTKKIPVFLLAIALCIFRPYCSFAWGKKGHWITAEIAFSLLNNNTKQFVQKYLGAMTIEDASVWMDEMRSDHSFDYMKPWHYVNIEKDKQYTATNDPNIINALNNAIEQLEHRDKLNDSEIKRNLLIVFHLTGDLHMPLHVGYGVDKGGNDIKVTYLGNPSNLHRVWDSEIIESEHISVDDCLALYKNYTKNEIDGLKMINVENWIKEPRSYLNDVYDFHDNAIDHAYIDKNKKTVEQQLLIAGIRLAAVLEKVAE
jgi:hypothetical protein